MSAHEMTQMEAVKGFRVGLFIAALTVVFERYGLRTAIGDLLRRLSFIPALILREAILVAIVVTSLVLNAAFSRWVQGDVPIFHYPFNNLLLDAAFSFAVC